MNDALAGYVNDHLAAGHAVRRLLESCVDDHEGEWQDRFQTLLDAVTLEHESLQRYLGERTEKSVLKTAGAHILSQIAKQRYSDARPGSLAFVELLEALCLGASGKLLLWETLESVVRQKSDAREFATFRSASADQVSVLKEWREEAAKSAFRASS
jgi:hypothetical protein